MPSKGFAIRHFRIFVLFCCIVHVLVSFWFFLCSAPSQAPTKPTYKNNWSRHGEGEVGMTHATTNISKKENIIFKCNLYRVLNVNAKVCARIARNITDTAQPLHQNDLLELGDQNKTDMYIRRVDKSCDITAINDDCNDVRQSYLYGKDGVTEEEMTFPLAFAIKLHSNANQAHRLLRYIYRKHNVYCIHVDKKASNIIHEYFVNISKCLDNIVVIEDRVSLVYSTIRQVMAEFRCIDAMLTSNIKWRYYINLTGKEFMLKTNSELVKILKILKGRNDVESYPMIKDSHKYKQKTIIIGQKAFISKLAKDPFHRNITIRKGSAYCMLSREFLKFAKIDTVAREFVLWLNDTYAPEEMIWATLNALENAPGGSYKGIIQTNKFLSRAVIWSLDKQYSCKGTFVRWVCIYGTGDLPWLLKHRNIVANKFEEDYQPLTLDCLEWSMYQRLMSNKGIGANFKMELY